jgi:hypothetical protein
MSFRHFTAQAITVLLLALQHAWAASPETQSAAVLFVQQQQLGRNLPAIGWMAATRTVTFATLVRQLGQAQATSLVRKKLEHYRGDYQATWDANLASAYADHLSADELNSLAKNGSSSPFASKLRAVQNDIGIEMQNTSKQLLTSYVTSALTDALKEAASANKPSATEPSK